MVWQFLSVKHRFTYSIPVIPLLGIYARNEKHMSTQPCTWRAVRSKIIHNRQAGEKAHDRPVLAAVDNDQNEVYFRRNQSWKSELQKIKTRLGVLNFWQTGKVFLSVTRVVSMRWPAEVQGVLSWTSRQEVKILLILCMVDHLSLALLTQDCPQHTNTWLKIPR